ncbi:hypothetical protein GGQ92_001805 [Gracilibacillus halotolerans]|uniref:Lipoprotein n=1 Tax=Gracilibacillus halotolerans TaxID=74386 RepID=A0A841RPB9_9BACI|nr:hypothetical protein [Gracilibacillus halotolerans]MBB6513015.1 hypothetical protein [Gracilibacillus halotolerans]
MKKSFLIYLLIFSSCFLLLSCEQGNENEPNNNKEENDDIEQEGEGETMSQEDALQFENIGKAPESDTKKPISEVAKVIFTESSLDTAYEPIAIDLENNEIYINPTISIHRFSSYEDTVQFDHAQKVKELLEKYDVQNWERDYTFEDPETYEDGYSWRLWLQFEDGTVEKHKGAGTSKKEITPENFEEFSKELRQLVNASLGGS